MYIAVVWTCTSIAGFIDITSTYLDSRLSPYSVMMILSEIYNFCVLFHPSEIILNRLVHV